MSRFGVLCLVFAFAFACLIPVSHVWSADKAPVKAEGKKFSGTADENIKKPQGKESITGEPQLRGHVCKVSIDNSTEWRIAVYLNGNYVGEAPPWGGLYVTASSALSLYGKAEFDDGTSRTWGPQSFDCAQDQSWELYCSETCRQ